MTCKIIEAYWPKKSMMRRYYSFAAFESDVQSEGMPHSVYIMERNEDHDLVGCEHVESDSMNDIRNAFNNL